MRELPVKITEALTGKAMGGAIVVATNSEGNSQTSVTNSKREYILGLQERKYTLSRRIVAVQGGTEDPFTLLSTMYQQMK